MVVEISEKQQEEKKHSSDGSSSDDDDAAGDEETIGLTEDQAKVAEAAGLSDQVRVHFICCL